MTHRQQPSAHGYALQPDGATLRHRDRLLPLEDDAWAAEQARSVPPRHLPVVIGAGRGELLALLSGPEAPPIAVLDAENALLEATHALQRAPAAAHIAAGDPASALDALAIWRKANGGAPLHPLANPTWLRLNPGLYAAVARALKDADPAPVQPPARGRRLPRLLVLRFGYYLEREICAALAALGADYAVLRADDATLADGAAFAKALIERAAQFRPDALLSINFLGGDMHGPLLGILDKLRLPFATWFVDSPELLLAGVATPPATGVVPFTCDPDGPAKLAALGLPGAHLLPLACDARRFDLDAPPPAAPPALGVSFVGNSWVDKLGRTHRNFRFPAPVLRGFKAVARDLATHRPSGPLAQYLAARHPDFAALLDALPPALYGGALHLLCWEGNRLYRSEQVRALLPLQPLIAGDRHWPRLLGPHGAQATTHPPIAYYGADLPKLYAASGVNFNCGGVQMPGAANQRLFDVPGCGGFLLSDFSRQVAQLFEPGREVICYAATEDIAPLAERYLKDRPAALRIIRAARARIAAEHTYEHRMRTMLHVLAQGAGRG